MITIIHGDNIAESREQFFRLKSEMQNPISMEGSSLDQNQLFNFFKSTDMFFTEKNLTVENFLSKNKLSKKLDEIVEIFNKNSKNTNILFWEEKELTLKTLNSFPNAQIQRFKIPKIIFNFLDGIKPGNGKYLIELFHKLLENSATEIISFMLVRQFRLMISLSSDKSDAIDELIRMAPWQRGKLEKQASLFENEKLIKLYSQLYNLDLGQKTGKLSMPMNNAIDIFLLNI